MKDQQRSSNSQNEQQQEYYNPHMRQFMEEPGYSNLSHYPQGQFTIHQQPLNYPVNNSYHVPNTIPTYPSSYIEEEKLGEQADESGEEESGDQESSNAPGGGKSNNARSNTML